jgi:hypothetical protein
LTTKRKRAQKKKSPKEKAKKIDPKEEPKKPKDFLGPQRRFLRNRRRSLDVIPKGWTSASHAEAD